MCEHLSDVNNAGMSPDETAGTLSDTISRTVEAEGMAWMQALKSNSVCGFVTQVRQYCVLFATIVNIC